MVTVYKDSSLNVINIDVAKVYVNSTNMALGQYFVGQSMVHVYNDAITQAAGVTSTRHKIVIGTNPPQFYVYPSVSVLKKDVLLHEILHLFGLGDNPKGKSGNGVYDIMCYAYNTATCLEPVIAREHQQLIQSCSVPK